MLLKTINYRGGIIRFQIPNDWVEEYEDVGGGTFYKPGDDTGTLRVNVMIRCWRILQALPPKNFRNVLFTYTVLADRFSSPASIEDMDLLDREIAAVQFAPKVGQLA